MANEKRVIVLEVSNASDEQIQNGLGVAFQDFCSKHKGAGITANVLESEVADKVTKFINEGGELSG